MTVRLLVVPSMIAAAHMAVIVFSRAIMRRYRRERLSGIFPSLPRWLRTITGSMDALSGVLLFVAGVRTLGVRRAMGERGRLEITGIYRYVRNPLYTGVVLIYWGLGWLLNRTYMLLGALLWFVFFQFAVREEERRLLWEHGSVFRQYVQDVPAFVPDFERLARDVRQQARDPGDDTPRS